MKLSLIAALLFAVACSSPARTSTTTGSSGASSSGQSAGTSSSSGSGAGSSSSNGGTPTGGSTGSPTFTADVQPIFAAHCETCHVPGGIAPSPLVTYQDALNSLAAIGADVQKGTMPPWPPDDSCNSYQWDRSMSAQDTATVLAWVAAGGPQGDPSLPPTPAAVPNGLSRVDLTLAMPAPYTPQISPDDYHCFMLDWPETTTQYVTGFALTPGTPQIVHHAIAYIAQPDQLASYYAQEQSLPDGGYLPSYTCFGGPSSMGALTGWLGVWTPGSSYGDLPAGTGVPIQPGSKIILQVHYNTLNGPGLSDLSSMQLELAPQVDKPAALIPFTDPYWIGTNQMDIPAGNASVDHSFQADPGPDLSSISNGVLQQGVPFTVYSAGAHMHLRGTKETLQVVRPNGQSECLIDVPAWKFRWQGSYFLQTPVVVNPGDQLSIDCQWDNSQANQPYVNGQQVLAHDIVWGEGTEDEMCLGMVYATE